MKKISLLIFLLILFNITFSNEISNERVVFRGTVLYEAKNPITMESNLNTIDFGTIIKGESSTVTGHTMTVTGSEGIKMSYSINSDLGITVIEKGVNRSTLENGVVEKYNYEYIWDTKKSKVDDLSGHRITFTATYE